MNTLGINNSAPAGRYGRRNLPVPVEKKTTAGSEDRPVFQGGIRQQAATRPGRRNLLRATAPFLAQLSIQYDGIEALRRARRERIDQAAQSYAGALSSRGTAAAGERHDFRS